MQTFELNENEGAVIFREEGQEFLVPESNEKNANQIRSAIAFFLFATQKEDWIDEFNIHVEEIMQTDDEEEELEEEEKKKKRAHLKIVKQKKLDFLLKLCYYKGNFNFKQEDNG